jgi:hypothetical protein
MPFVVKKNVPFDSIDIALLGADGVMFLADDI